MNGAINGENYGLEATLENNSVPGKINGLLDGKVTTPQHNAAVHLGVYADKDKAHGDLKSTVNGREYSVMVETTRTSILVDANIIRHIYIDAKVSICFRKLRHMERFALTYCFLSNVCFISSGYFNY